MRNGKRILLGLTLCALVAFLCSCTGDGLPLAPNTTELTLPPAIVNYVAPIGDAALEYTATATLYLPRHDDSRLIAVSDAVSFSAARPHAESITRALLNHPGDGVASALGGDVKLSLYGVNPVEVSRDVATVNLAASALQLDRKAFYLTCQSIANTLTELPEISYVNVLVVDKPLGLNIANTLPMGTFSRSAGQDIGAVYEQLLSRRVEASESATEKTLSTNVTLYFPLSDSPGVMSEVRTCSFSNQVFSDMVLTLLRELAAGPQQNIASPALPLLTDLLIQPPALIYSEASGGQIVTLDFAYNLDEMLEANGISRSQSMASLCYTLCSFYPNLAGISVRIGDAPVSSLMLTEDFGSSVEFKENCLRRTDFAPLLYDHCTLYFAAQSERKLVATQRSIPYYQRRNPRSLLLELSKGPQTGDSIEGLAAVMPQGGIQDADILGLALVEDTMLINLAPSFAQIGTDFDEDLERLLAYAIVNTLCCDARMKSVYFFLSGNAFEGFTGSIYWPGRFYPLPN